MRHGIEIGLLVILLLIVVVSAGLQIARALGAT